MSQASKVKSIKSEHAGSTKVFKGIFGDYLSFAHLETSVAMIGAWGYGWIDDARCVQDQMELHVGEVLFCGDSMRVVTHRLNNLSFAHLQCSTSFQERT